MPLVAERAGAAFAADGTMVNNVLGFPGIFRGALAAGADRISTRMKLAAAHAIAGLTAESELVPDALDPKVHAEVATAVAEAARDEGIARPERVPAGLWAGPAARWLIPRPRVPGGACGRAGQGRRA